MIAFSLPVSASATTTPGVKPGSFFYFFDTILENVELFFIFNPEKKARKALEYANERLAEIDAIAGGDDPNVIKTAIANYENNIALATKKLKEIKDNRQAESLLALIEDNTSKNLEVLFAVLMKVPEEAREAVSQVIETSRKGQEEAAKKIVENKGGVEQQKIETTPILVKPSAPPKEESKSTATSDIPKAVVNDGISASALINPAAQCLDPKKKWDNFIKSIDEIDTKFLSLQSSYSQGTENTPEETVAYFSYKYNIALSSKTKFLSDAGNIRKMLEIMPSPPLAEMSSSATYPSATQIRTNYLNSLDYMESAYDLRLLGFKVIAEDKDGVLKSDTQVATALLNDSFKKYESSVTESAKNKIVITLLKSAMNVEYLSSCYFGFGTDNIIRTTIKEEQRFSQTQPSFSANKDYTQAIVAISTNLPIEITEDGKTKTVMQLNCAGNIIQVQRIDHATVHAKISKVLVTGHQCAFTYSGNGSTITTLKVTLLW